jgi:hypothetical protein
VNSSHVSDPWDFEFIPWWTQSIVLPCRSTQLNHLHWNFKKDNLRCWWEWLVTGFNWVVFWCKDSSWAKRLISEVLVFGLRVVQELEALSTLLVRQRSPYQSLIYVMPRFYWLHCWTPYLFAMSVHDWTDATVTWEFKMMMMKGSFFGDLILRILLNSFWPYI